MHGNRHEHGVGTKNRSDLVRQPAGGRIGEVGPVAMFQRKDEPPPRITINERRAPPRPWTIDLAALVAEIREAVALARQGRSAGVAGVAVDKVNVPPACRAKRAGTRHQFPAKRALIRVKSGNCPL